MGSGLNCFAGRKREQLTGIPVYNTVTVKTVGKRPLLFSFLFLPIFSCFFSYSCFFAETLYDRFLRDTVPVGTGFSRPVFNPKASQTEASQAEVGAAWTKPPERS